MPLLVEVDLAVGVIVPEANVFETVRIFVLGVLGKRKGI